MKARVEHRRAHMRFEVLGTMSASVLSTETLRVLNVGLSGALVEGAMPLPANAEYRMQLVLESHVSEVTVKVRRVAAVPGDRGSMRYQIGLEFLALSPEGEEAISQIVLANQAQV
ncbi:MAG: PilZ domain-containing protein [Vicinamibacterales bacterium]